MQVSKAKTTLSNFVETTTIAAILVGQTRRRCSGDVYVIESRNAVLYAGATATGCAQSRIKDHVGKQWHLSALGKLFRSMPVQALKWRVHIFSTIPGAKSFDAERELIALLRPSLNVLNNTKPVPLPASMRERIAQHDKAVQIAARHPLTAHRAVISA